MKKIFIPFKHTLQEIDMYTDIHFCKQVAAFFDATGYPLIVTDKKGDRHRFWHHQTIHLEIVN